MHELDKKRVRASFARAARSYDEAAVLQREIGDRLLSRLDVIRHRPRAVLEVGSGTGYCSSRLEKRYRARVIALDIVPAMLAQARAHRPWLSRQRFVCGDAEALPIRGESMDMVFSNLTLQWCRLDRALPELARVLRPGAPILFTTFGPDTLYELRQAWQEADAGGEHVHRFIDMHDIGDALLRAGFAEPVMDVERVVLTYTEVQHVLRDLKGIGAHNALAQRRTALTGKQRFARFEAAYEDFRRQGRLPATYEVVYGHAWAPLQKPSSIVRADGSVAVPLSRIGRA